MAMLYPCAYVSSWVLHDVFNCCVVDERLEEGIFGCFVDDSLNWELELGSICVGEYWWVQVAVACGPQLYYGLPADLYDFHKELVAIDLWRWLSDIVMPHASEAAV